MLFPFNLMLVWALYSVITGCSDSEPNLVYRVVVPEEFKDPNLPNNLRPPNGDPSFTGMKQRQYAAKSLRSNDSYKDETMRRRKLASTRLLVCVENRGYSVSLEKRKIYLAVPDEAAAKHDLVRVIDESGEDYLYPKTFFLPITLPHSVRKAVLEVA